MQSITIEELIFLIKKERINFVASAITPWHAHGVDCCVTKLIDDNININGIILIEMHADSGYVINESHFSNTNCKIFRVGAPTIKGVGLELKFLWLRIIAPYIFNNIDSKDYPVYLASSWHINLDLFLKLQSKILNCSFHFMVFEEGLATYFPFSESFMTIWNSTGTKKRLLTRIISFCFRLTNKFLLNQFEKKVPSDCLNLLILKGNKYVLNDLAAIYYKQILNNRCSKNIFTANNYSIFEDSVIICTMTFPREDIYNNSYIKLLKTITDYLLSEKIKVVIKPHPREHDYKKYYMDLNCPIFDQKDMTMEMIMTICNIRSIVSFSSTTLITSSLLFNIKSISLIDMIEFQNYGDSIKGEMMSFKKIFSDFVLMPNTIKQLQGII